ncbi:TonB-dependent receptor domain-containing protein [Fibrella forsythiae]|uniref:TonB-dependent receptor n=1 Tax=Fibrella forsythiae TaxID=2817061 RepID=A0ABS3JP08_9BACT|nr:TonB-dependent receptor [Fibrella forsythiae]MBO0951723.1 TonB-dependent receptor [Fibrella forsythiae]
MARLLYSTLFLFVLLSASAQTITGTIQNTGNTPASFAALKLLRTADSTFVKGTVADEAGRFTFGNVPAGSYRVQASFVGMTDATTNVVSVYAGQATYLEPIVLRSSAQAMKTVTVRASKPYVDQQADKTVLNVAANASAQSKTAYELLQQAPGVVIDPNDNVRMAGKQGVNVYIDGKPANLSSRDLANLLRATPAANIATVELITNPSARYDAQGGAGIINIKFRRDKSLGLNGNASAGYGQSDHYRANAAVDLNYRAKRLNLFGNLSGSDNFQNTNVSINRYLTGTRFAQRGFDSDGTRAVVYKAGADYAIGTRHTVGLIVAGNRASNQFGTYTTTDIFGKRTTPDSSLTNRVDSPSNNDRINAALNYQYTDTLGMNLYVDADYTNFANTAPSRISSDFVDADRRPLYSTQNRFDANTDITILTFRADLTKEWKSRSQSDASVTLEAGFKHTDVDTNNDLLAFTGFENRPDATRTNRFTYREIVTAAYASLNRKTGKLTMQAGLRAENSTVNGRSTDLLNRIVNRPDTTYLNLFPTAYVQYQVSKNGQLSLNYGRRIGRPNYQDMNPFVYQIDPYTSQRGNPFLRPTYTHNAELSYTYKWSMTVKVAYSSTSDFSTDVIRQEGLTAYQTVANVGKANVLNLSLNTPIPIKKWWNAYLYAGATWNRYQGEITTGQAFDQRAFAFEGYMQHSFTLSNVWEAQISGFWNAPTRQTIYQIGGLGALNLNVQKKVMDGRGRVSFGIDDLLNTMRWKQAGEFAGGAQFDIYRKWESRRATIRFSYRFGNNEVKGVRERKDNTGVERIKTKGNL